MPSSVPFWFTNPCDCDVYKIWGPFGPLCWLPTIHLQHQHPIVLVFTQYKLGPWVPPCMIPVRCHHLRGRHRDPCSSEWQHVEASLYHHEGWVRVASCSRWRQIWWQWRCRWQCSQKNKACRATGPCVGALLWYLWNLGEHTAKIFSCFHHSFGSFVKCTSWSLFIPDLAQDISPQERGYKLLNHQQLKVNP